MLCKYYVHNLTKKSKNEFFFIHFKLKYTQNKKPIKNNNLST